MIAPIPQYRKIKPRMPTTWMDPLSLEARTMYLATKGPPTTLKMPKARQKRPLFGI